MALLQSVLTNASRTAVADVHGHFTFQQLLTAAIALQKSIAPLLSKDDESPRIAYAVPREHRYLVSKLATWLVGGIGVPLAESHPKDELKYALQDSGANVIVVTSERKAIVSETVAEMGANIHVIDVPVIKAEDAMLSLAELESASKASPSFSDHSRGAFLIYTSGTTGRPKGVLTTHSTLVAQTFAMGSAWGWSQNDRILSVLPLHHVHGIVAVVLTALAYGACVEFPAKFLPSYCWESFARPVPASDQQAQTDPAKFQPTLFMGVPTVYVKLLEAHGKAEAETAGRWAGGLTRPESVMRLMVSGSAALPESVARAWKNLTSHTLLERYGMTEFAMAISNPLSPVESRKLNSVGRPLPGYEARLVPETEGADPKDGGELQIRGPGVFTQYWGKPAESKASFTDDGWFRTGDRAIIDSEGCYSIQGRLSADIIKSGGYKISALDIERELLEDGAMIAEVAVLGLPDETWGEKVAAVVVLTGPERHTGPRDEASVLQAMRTFAASRLAPYKLPTVVKVLPEMPRNAMGKVNKKALRKEVFGL